MKMDIQSKMFIVHTSLLRDKFNDCVVGILAAKSLALGLFLKKVVRQ